MAENNNEVAKVAINDIGTEEDFIKAVDSTIKNFDDGDLVEGTVVKVDHDEVLLDIGYKTEGVIPSRELSIKKDVDPDEVVEVGDTIEALVVTKEDKEGRLILSKKRAQYERAWGDIETIKEADGVVEGTVIEAVKAAGYTNVILRPLMVVAGDHANNDMAGADEDSWKTMFEAAGLTVNCQISGLGRIDAIHALYVAHTKAAIDAIA